MKYLPGVGGGTQSGSEGGVTASRNRGGQYFRRRAIPSNTLTVARDLVRSRLGGLSSSWRTLTSDQQNAWNTWGPTIPTIDSLGQSVLLSGQQAYIKVNQRLALYAAAVTDPPATMTVAALEALAITTSTTGPLALALTVAPAPIPADSTLLVWATPPLSPGLRNVRRFFRSLGTSGIGIGGTVNLATRYIAVFGEPAAPGPAIWVQAQFLNTTNGQVSPPLLASAILA